MKRVYLTDYVNEYMCSILNFENRRVRKYTVVEYCKYVRCS